jgi:hypothetical protein
MLGITTVPAKEEFVMADGPEFTKYPGPMFDKSGSGTPPWKVPFGALKFGIFNLPFTEGAKQLLNSAPPVLWRQEKQQRSNFFHAYSHNPCSWNESSAIHPAAELTALLDIGLQHVRVC